MASEAKRDRRRLGRPRRSRRGRNRPGAVEGAVDSLAPDLVTGWAWDPARPEDRLAIVVSVDGEQVAEGRADLDVPALAELGAGDGRHGFSIPLELEGVGRERITVQAGDDRTTLPDGPVTPSPGKNGEA